MTSKELYELSENKELRLTKEQAVDFAEFSVANRPHITEGPGGYAANYYTDNYTKAERRINKELLPIEGKTVGETLYRMWLYHQWLLLRNWNPEIGLLDAMRNLGISIRRFISEHVNDPHKFKLEQRAGGEIKKEEAGDGK